MLIKQDKLKHFLEVKNLSKSDFALKLDIPESEVDKMLSGTKVGLYTSRKFIRFFKAEIAQSYIDWNKLGIENPLAKDYNDNYGNEATGRTRNEKF